MEQRFEFQQQFPFDWNGDEARTGSGDNQKSLNRLYGVEMEYQPKTSTPKQTLVYSKQPVYTIHVSGSAPATGLKCPADLEWKLSPDFARKREYMDDCGSIWVVGNVRY